MLVILLLTHSIFGFVVFVFLKTRPLFEKSKFIKISLIFSIFILSYLLSNANAGLFFQNSGLIRLIGVLLLKDLKLSNFIFGNGIASGDELLLNTFENFGVYSANGFLFSLIYDIGLIGSISIIIVYAENIYDVLLIILLLLNLSAGNFLFPILYFLSKNYILIKGKVGPNSIPAKLKVYTHC
jgi:hypothetical protein